MIPHDQRRYEKINVKLLELENVQEIPVREIGFSPCDGYAVHGEIPKDYTPFNGYWCCKIDEHAWFCFEPIYPIISEKQTLFLKVDTGAEGWDAANPQAMLFYDGKAVRAMDVNHTMVKFPQGVKKVDAYMYSGTMKPETEKTDNRPLTFTASFVVRDDRVHALQTKIYVLIDILQCLGDEETDRAVISETLRLAVNELDFTQPYSKAFYDSIERAEAVLAARAKDDAHKPTSWAIGHTHIDYAWLWTKKQTKEKVLRSFGTVLSLLEEYPTYRFMSSQAALYQDIKDQDSEMYAKIKKAVASGRWEAEGGMWVEPDCNLTSGESLVRQILVGKKFFKEEFNVDNKILWLPDVFGYSANLPQLLRKSGIDFFVTSKISWNETNRMPHEIFTWQGIDGSTIDSYFITTQRKVKDTPTHNYSTYIGEGHASEVLGTYQRLTDKNLTEEVIMPTGFGDGGGGTTPQMIEMIDYISTGLKGCNRSGFIGIGEFAARLKENIKDKSVPRWVGDLYLEYHRGTYSSISKMKRNNRRGEFAVWNTEWESVMAKLLKGKQYPKEVIDHQLKVLLTNQFHDILPGTCVDEEYEATDKEYAAFFQELGQIEKDSLSLIAEHVYEKGICVFNPNSFEGRATVVVNGKTVGVRKIPSKGYAVLSAEDYLATNNIIASETGIENTLYKIVFNSQGKIVSFIDKRVGRELVKEGGLFNNLIAYENLPFEYENWELKEYYKEKAFPVDNVVHTEVVNDGVRKGVRFTYAFINSTIIQTVWLYENLSRVDCETELDWHEHQLVLRTESDTTILTDKATYEIQYGNITRPAHGNNPWDAAKFEVCAHKFVDVAEYDYGISLLNDCKYGHSVRGGKIGLTLLTCGTYPSRNADQGKHVFTYSFMPHSGDFRTAKVIEQAYLLNNPMVAVRADGKGNLISRFSLIRSTNSNIIIEVVKQAEDGKGLIVRAYESCGGRATTQFEFGVPIGAVSEVNLIEEDKKPIAFTETTFVSDFMPFEIKTFYIETK